MSVCFACVVGGLCFVESVYFVDLLLVFVCAGWVFGDLLGCCDFDDIRRSDLLVLVFQD